VMPDADMSLVVDALVEGAMGSTGQRCTASERLLVHESIADDLLERLAARVGALRVGDGLDPETEIGPVATSGAQQSINDDFAKATSEGADLLAASPLDTGLT